MWGTVTPDLRRLRVRRRAGTLVRSHILEVADEPDHGPMGIERSLGGDDVALLALAHTYARHPDETLHLYRNVQQDIHHTALCNGFLSAADSAVVRKTDAEYKSTTQKALTRVPAGRIRRILPTTTTCIPTYLHSSHGIGFSLPATDTLSHKMSLLPAH